MKIAERIQAAIHTLEVGRGARVMSVLAILAIFSALAVLFNIRAYHGFSAPEAMDAAQVARNLSQGKGFTTDFIRPFSIYLLDKHNRPAKGAEISTTNAPDHARVNGPHPDLANAPLYPLLLAGYFKAWPPQWKVEMKKPFWSEGGGFRRYQPEFRIAILNQVLLFIVVLQTFFLARKLSGPPAAWLAAVLTLGSVSLWNFTVSGQSTLLVLVIFLGLILILVSVEQRARAALPDVSRLLLLAGVAGLVTALGMLTRYTFGWLIAPVIIFLWQFGGERRKGMAVTAALVFAAAVAPWLARNYFMSGTLFGTAGFAVVEGTFGFPGSRLMQSLHPDMLAAYWLVPYGRKLFDGLQSMLQNEIFRALGWAGVLFFAGLLLALTAPGQRRLRYFTLMSLGVFILAGTLGRTQLSIITPDCNSENLLVLLLPLVVIFGAISFLALLERIELPTIETLLASAFVLALLVWLPLLTTFSSKASTVSYPPYYPPDIQKICGWMDRDELMMSDIPWAVAWYGHQPCAWTTINSQYEFYQLNDYVRPVNGLYLSLNTLDGKLFSECLQGGVDSWGNFTLKTVTLSQLPPGFPLKNFPAETLISGMFLSDRVRW